MYRANTHTHTYTGHTYRHIDYRIERMQGRWWLSLSSARCGWIGLLLKKKRNHTNNKSTPEHKWNVTEYKENLTKQQKNGWLISMIYHILYVYVYPKRGRTILPGNNKSVIVVIPTVVYSTECFPTVSISHIRSMSIRSESSLSLSIDIDQRSSRRRQIRIRIDLFANHVY